MKRHEKRQKLNLSRETLRRLECSDLAGVVGGSLATCIPERCTTGYAYTLDCEK